MDTIINTPEYARSLIEASLDTLVTINADGKIIVQYNDLLFGRISNKDSFLATNLILRYNIFAIT